MGRDTGESERCECSYMCKRARPDDGYLLVSKRTKRRHALKERNGLLATDLGVQREAVRSKWQSESAVRNFDEVAVNVGDVINVVHGRRATECGTVFRSFHRREWEPIASVDEDEFPSRGQSIDDHRTMVSDRYLPSIDEAIYRKTWKMQAILDRANVPLSVQEEILRTIYGESEKEVREGSDPMNFTLGALLRCVGSEWTGGELGLRGLCSFHTITKHYRLAGMPSTQRWRLCFGSPDVTHEPVLYSPSKQDEYVQSAGAKCRCVRNPPSSLQRDCRTCSERCSVGDCKQMRRCMPSFDYICIGEHLKKLCESRTFCHELLQMWRCRGSWMGNENTDPHFPLREWWDGQKAKEISWFFDSNSEFELPIICRSCWQVYPTIPEKCRELRLECNFDPTSNSYNFVCSCCGERIEAAKQMVKVRTVYVCWFRSRSVRTYSLLKV